MFPHGGFTPLNRFPVRGLMRTSSQFLSFPVATITLVVGRSSKYASPAFNTLHFIATSLCWVLCSPATTTVSLAIVSERQE